jgi:hypothetical protein
MAAHFLREIDLSGASGDWRDQMVAYWSEMRRVALLHPQLLALARRVLPTPAQSWSLMERQLELMQTAGLDLDASVALYRVLHRYTVGSVVLDIATGPAETADDQSRRFAERAASLSAEEFPSLVEVGRRYPPAPPEQLFAAELRRLIDLMVPPAPV